MHITPEHAALIAQVYPTLVIALVLEGRFGSGRSWGRWVNLAHHVVRLLAILGAVASTFACLTIARTEQGEDFTDWMVSITHYLLIAAFAAMAGTILGTERDVIMRDFKKRSPAQEEKVAAER